MFLLLVMCAMKNRILASHMTTRRFSVVVLTNYVDDFTISYRHTYIYTYKEKKKKKKKVRPVSFYVPA